MSQSYVNLIYHIVFSTKDRKPFITEKYRTRLYDYIGGTIRAEGGISLELNGMPDHVHILTKLPPDKALSDMLRSFKANASGWLHRVFPELHEFSWQRGYAAFTVSASQVTRVSRYIANQQTHHQKQSYREEFIALLKGNGIEFDERFLWQ